MRISYSLRAALIEPAPELDSRFVDLVDASGNQIARLFWLGPIGDTYGTVQNPVDQEVFGALLKKLASGAVQHLSEYDALVFASRDIIYRKAMAALCRLEYPHELTDQNRNRYIAYLRQNAEYILPRLVREKNMALVSLMGEHAAIPAEGLQDLIDKTLDSDELELSAYLMAYKNRAVGFSSALQSGLDPKPAAEEWVTVENDDATLTITGYRGEAESVIVPSEINGKAVRCLEGRMGSLLISIFFHKRDIVKSVVVPNGVMEIGNRAFSDCPNLQSVELPASVRRVGSAAFSHCTKLRAIAIPPEVEALEAGTFWGCTTLHSAALPASLTAVGDHAFSDCEKLQSITIPASVTAIGEGAFSGCAGLQSIAIPASVTAIGEGAFSGCAGLQSIIIPANVKEVASSTFSGCDDLRSVVIMSAATRIISNAFWGRKDLVVRAPKGSSAEQFAEHLGIQFEELVN